MLNGLTFIPTPLLVGVAAYFLALGATLFWESAAQTAFLRVVRTKQDPASPILPAEYWAKYSGRPWRWPLEAPRLTTHSLTLAFTSSADPEIESARRRMHHRHKVRLVVTFALLPLPFLLLALWS